MKKIKYAIMVWFLIFAGVACADLVMDLDKEPLGVPSSAILHDTDEGIEMLVNGSYAFMRGGYGFFPRFVGVELGSDDANPGSTPADGPVGAMQQFSNFTYLTSYGELGNFYTINYQLIARTNQVINHAPDVDMDPVLKARYIGEAKFLRAFAYFHLVRGWGGVPIFTEVPADPGEASESRPRSSREEVYELIITDLEDAIESLPEKSEYPASDLGRATKGAARTILAQVYLLLQDYTNALNYAMDVIDSGEYGLHDTYDQNFMVEHQNGRESIFEIQFISREEMDIGSYATWQQVRGYVGWGFFSPSEELANAYEPGDPRRGYSIFFEGEAWPGSNEVPVWESGTDPRANRKTMLPQPWPAGYPDNSPVNVLYMRYADVILMAAEANNELGNTGDALMYLEMIRERAREGDPAVLPGITATNQTELRHAIWDERRFELALEGYRFFDIRRYDVVEPGYAEQLYHSIGKTNFNPNQHNLYPIPQSEIDFSGGELEQNPGW